MFFVSLYWTARIETSHYSYVQIISNLSCVSWDAGDESTECNTGFEASQVPDLKNCSVPDLPEFHYRMQELCSYLLYFKTPATSQPDVLSPPAVKLVDYQPANLCPSSKPKHKKTPSHFSPLDPSLTYISSYESSLATLCLNPPQR